MKGSFKNEVDEALENKPIIKETIGGILGIFIPLHICLKDIDSVHMGETGKVTINLSYRRHITIQFESKHAEEFVNRLNQLKRKAKDREIKEHVMQVEFPPSSYVTVPYWTVSVS